MARWKDINSNIQDKIKAKYETSKDSNRLLAEVLSKEFKFKITEKNLRDWAKANGWQKSKNIEYVKKVANIEFEKELEEEFKNQIHKLEGGKLKKEYLKKLKILEDKKVSIKEIEAFKIEYLIKFQNLKSTQKKDNINLKKIQKDKDENSKDNMKNLSKNDKDSVKDEADNKFNAKDTIRKIGNFSLMIISNNLKEQHKTGNTDIKSINEFLNATEKVQRIIANLGDDEQNKGKKVIKIGVEIPADIEF